MAIMDQKPEPGSPEFEEWRKKHPIPAPPSVYLAIYVFLGCTIAVGYVVYRLAGAAIIWAIANNLVYGFAGAFGVMSAGLVGVWLYFSKPRVFGFFEMLIALVLGFGFTQRFFVTSPGTDPFGIAVEIIGAILLFINGTHKLKHGAGQQVVPADGPRPTDSVRG